MTDFACHWPFEAEGTQCLGLSYGWEEGDHRLQQSLSLPLLIRHQQEV